MSHTRQNTVDTDIPIWHVSYMKLEHYIEANGLTHAEFANKIGVTASSVTRYLLGLRTPRKPTLLKIIAATNGMVTANDFLSDADLIENAA